MINEDILKEITINDLPNLDLRIIANACGLETALKLMCNAPGVRFYVPSNGLRIFMEKYILKNRSLCVKELAINLGVSESQIYTILHEQKIDTKTIPIAFDTTPNSR